MPDPIETREGEPLLPRLEADVLETPAIDAVGSVDGRYRRVTAELAPYLSERALIATRIEVEARYLEALSGTVARPFSAEERQILRELPKITVGEASAVKRIETKGYLGYDKTDHDVKAVEYFMREKLKGTSLADSLELIHFGLTSEDVNNLSYALMLSRATEEVMVPAIEDVISEFNQHAEAERLTAMLARTHGQPATPTTFGKEAAVFASRLRRQVDDLLARPVLGKLNGASGNYSAHMAARPDIDWISFSQEFVRSLGDGAIRIEPNLVTTQIEPHDTYAELFDNLRRINTILIDANQDIWRYISDNWIRQRAQFVGSSTMPHKVNPIKFENSEGNLGIANALLEFHSRKLPVSRLQRDLSDSTVERTFGTAFAHSLIGYRSMVDGFQRIAVDGEALSEAVTAHPEVLGEAIQTVLRAAGQPGAYERLKEFTQGQPVTLELLREFIDQLELDRRVKDHLRSFRPEDYIGLAPELTRIHLDGESS